LRDLLTYLEIRDRRRIAAAVWSRGVMRGKTLRAIQEALAAKVLASAEARTQ